MAAAVPRLRRGWPKRMRVLQYLWFHFIMSATGWLPDLRPVLRARGFLLRPAFKACGTNFQIAAARDHQFYQSPGNRPRCLYCDGLLVARLGRNRHRGRGATWALRVLVTGDHTREGGSYRHGPSKLGADSSVRGFLGGCARHRHEECDRWTRRTSCRQLGGDARHSGVRRGGRRARADHSTKITNRNRGLKFRIVQDMNQLPYLDFEVGIAHSARRRDSVRQARVRIVPVRSRAGISRHRHSAGNRDQPPAGRRTDRFVPASICSVDAGSPCPGTTKDTRLAGASPDGLPVVGRC